MASAEAETSPQANRNEDMNCAEFRELSEAYLNDELLVETNIQVFRHMEVCEKCRADFKTRKELRLRIRKATVASRDLMVDPAFLTRLSATLREQHAGFRPYSFAWFSTLRLATAVAALVVIAGGAYLFLPWPFSGYADLRASVIKTLTEASLKAIAQHEDCAIEKMDRWTSGSVPISPSGRTLAAAVMEPLDEGPDRNIQLTHAHDCAFEGRVFSHVILSRSGHTISVFIDKAQTQELEGIEAGAIVSENQRGLQVAFFAKDGKGIFVISDLPESENMALARSLSGAFTAVNKV